MGSGVRLTVLPLKEIYARTPNDECGKGENGYLWELGLTFLGYRAVKTERYYMSKKLLSSAFTRNSTAILFEAVTHSASGK